MLFSHIEFSQIMLKTNSDNRDQRLYLLRSMKRVRIPSDAEFSTEHNLLIYIYIITINYSVLSYYFLLILLIFYINLLNKNLNK